MAATIATECSLPKVEALAARDWSLTESQRYCRQLARGHYENFVVASLLLPRRMRQHFYNVYAYCRWSDDLADEAPDPSTSLRLLDWWEAELRACYQGIARHPVFVALAETIEIFAIPIEPLARLLTAFRRDQRQRAYASRADLLDYCTGSADPVGELILYLGKCHRDDTLRLSNSICTGLQLANFWQDVARDWQMGRRYLPDETLRQFGCDVAVFEQRRATPEFRAALAAEVEQAQSLLTSGLALVDLVPRELKLDVWLFAQGGLAVLQKIRDLNYDVWSRRPTVSKWRQLRMTARGWRLSRTGRLHGRTAA